MIFHVMFANERRSTLDLEAETDLPATYSQTDPNYMSSRERWPIQHTASQQW